MAISASLGEARLLRVDGGAIAYRDTGGDERPILFVHGVLVNADLWRAVVPLLTPQYRCIAPDWPFGGHEYAMAAHADLSPPGIARTIGETLERLDLQDAILVANDTGAAFSQIALAHHGDRIGAVVLTNGDAFEQFFPAPLTMLPLVARVPGSVSALAPLLRTKTGGTLLARSLAHAPPPEPVLRSYLAGTRNREVRRDLTKLLAAVRNVHTLEAAAHFASFAKPVAIGWGSDDLYFTDALGERLAGAFPHATLRRIPASRTLVPEDAPLAVAELVRDAASRRS